MKSEELQRELMEAGQFLPELVQRQTETINDAAHYYGVYQSYPTDIRFDPGLMGTSVYGYQTSDKYGVTIGYNPDIRKMPKNIREGIADHEAVHVAQPGKENLLNVHAVVDFGNYKLGVPIGRYLIEGGAEHALERIGRKRTGAYPELYDFATAMDRYVPLRDLYKAAEHSPEKAMQLIGYALQQPGVGRCLVNALCRGCSKN